MSESSPFAEGLRMAFRPTSRGVVGLVDDLLGLCEVHQLGLRFEEGSCLVRRLGADIGDSLTVPIPKSVVRAALARIAALCDEQHPGSVTPYRGAGELAVPPPRSPSSTPPSTCHVSFVNTPAEQHLEMRFSRSSAGEENRFTVLLRDQRIITVHGHALQYIPNATNAADLGSYGVLSRGSSGDVLIALFRASEVIGVFRSDRSESGGNASSESVMISGREAQRQEAANAPSWPI